MAYEKYWNPSPNFTDKDDTANIKRFWPSSNGKREITAIAIHWWDDPSRKPSFEGVVSVLRNSSRQASAHYVAEAGRVAQLVKEEDISWATGTANWFTISIECNPRQSSADYDTIGELVADIWKRHGKIPLVPHNKYASTRCPGTYSLAKIKSIAEAKIAPPPPKPPAEIKYTKLATKQLYRTNKQPTNLWDFSGSKWTDFKSVAKYDKDHGVEVYGTAKHPLGSTYLMTQYSFDKKNNNGFNAVDMIKVLEPTPKPPEDENDGTTPEPPKQDPTDGDSSSGGERISELEDNISSIKSFFNKLLTLIKELLDGLS